MAAHKLSLLVAAERWALEQPFVISRGVKSAADVVVATVSDGITMGRGEAVPYARYGESVDDVVGELEALGECVPNRATLNKTMKPGAARNALDCALWDFEAKQSHRSVNSMIGRAGASENPLKPRQTAFTLSLGTADEMAAAAHRVPQHACLKLKLGGDGDDARMAAVRHARPDAELIGDANEAWNNANIEALLSAAASATMAVIEQPLPAEHDAALADITRLVPICADESAHTTDDLTRLVGRYDAVNIKLDKTGGLTEALRMLSSAKELGFDVMIGCMVATSLAMAPAFLLAQHARWVDLDGPLLLANDRPHGLDINDGVIAPPSRELWG